MKFLNHAGAVVSMAMLAAGTFLLFERGLSPGGISAFIAGAVCAFCLSLTLQVFALRRRIEALEKGDART